MELREFAETVLLQPDLDLKISVGDGDWTDESPGEALRVSEPERSASLQFALPRAAPAMPKFGGLHEPERRAIAHHIMANHELQALEAMAWTLLAFPDAPQEFRIGMANIMRDEQRHTRMHAERAAKLGVEFGSLPVNCYIWKKVQEFQSVLDYVAGLPLVFEGANLDHTLEFAQAFSEVGDERSAALMRVIHRDEIEHVRFGWEWMNRLAEENEEIWDVWTKHLHWPLRPLKAKGEQFQREARLAAGMSEEFVNQLENFRSEDE